MESDSDDQYGEDDADNAEIILSVQDGGALLSSSSQPELGKTKRKKGLWKRFKHKTKPVRKLTSHVKDKIHHHSHKSLRHSDEETLPNKQAQSLLVTPEVKLQRSPNYSSLPRSHRFEDSIRDRKTCVEMDDHGAQHNNNTSDSDNGARMDKNRKSGKRLQKQSSSTSSKKALSFQVNENRHSKSSTDAEFDVPHLLESVGINFNPLKMIW